MVHKSVVRIGDRGNSALSVCAAGLREFIFGDYQHSLRWIDFDRGAQTRQATTKDQDIDKIMRNVLGVEGDQEAGSLHEHPRLLVTIPRNRRAISSTLAD